MSEISGKSTSLFLLKMWHSEFWTRKLMDQLWQRWIDKFTPLDCLFLLLGKPPDA